MSDGRTPRTQLLPALNVRQQRFVDRYLVEPNATAAAAEAGYKRPNQQGPRLLKHPAVAAAISEAQAARAERTRVTADDVVRVAWEIAQDADQPTAARVSALTLLSKHTGGFREQIDVRYVEQEARKAADQFGLHYEELHTEVQRILAASR